jgi:hypothetical protein
LEKISDEKNAPKMGDKGEMTNQIKAMIFGNRSAAPQADQKPKKPRTIAYDRHSLVEIGKNTARLEKIAKKLAINRYFTSFDQFSRHISF